MSSLEGEQGRTFTTAATAAAAEQNTALLFASDISLAGIFRYSPVERPAHTGRFDCRPASE